MTGFADDLAELIRAGHVARRVPARSVTYGADDLYGDVGYNPWDGYTVIGWPDLDLLMGQPRVQDGACLGTTGKGGWI